MNELLGSYPYFSSFALIHDGQQTMKWTLASFLTPMVQIPDRDYVNHWDVPRPGEDVYLDSIRSRTTGQPEAILSSRYEVSEKEHGVSAITIPLHSLLDPVIVAGFGFAVIDDDGRVFFHSDSEHNLSESFFAETDNSRRLRALVGARHAELLNLRYWGEDHRAYLKPLDLAELKPSNPADLKPLNLQSRSWSLIVFYDKHLIRTSNMETLISAVFYTLAYAGVFVVVALGVLVFRPTYRAPWLWPNARHAQQYLQLTVVYLALAAAFVVAIAAFSPGRLLMTSWLLPLVACCLTGLVLRSDARPARLTPLALASVALVGLLIIGAGISWIAVSFDLFLIAGSLRAFHIAWRSPSPSMSLAPPLNVSYSAAVAGFVVLTTVLPATGFFDVSHGIHTQNLIKFGQLTLARAQTDRDEQQRTADRRQITGGATTVEALRANWRQAHPGVGTYSQFFFQTASTECRASNEDPWDSLLPAFLEERLPYYSESSVRLRELMHGRAADKSWVWSADGRELVFCGGPPALAARTALRSDLLPLFGGWAPGGLWLGALLLAGALVVACAGVFVYRFIMRRIFVVEVIEPLWSGRAVGTAAPAPQLLVLSPKEGASRFLQPRQYHLVDLEQAGRGNKTQRRWLTEQADAIIGTPNDWNVLILHFDRDLNDSTFTESKLSFVERLVTTGGRTVAIVSAVPPDRLFAERWAALRSACGVVTPESSRPHVARASETPQLDWRPARISELLWRLNTLRFSRRTAFLDDERRDPFIESQWSQVLPFAWQTDPRPALDIEQLLIEVGDRVENYYQALWQSCSGPERVVLEHVATERLVNEKSSQTVRALMARGLIERRPHFDVMNETFRRFVATRASDQDVTDLEHEHSTWTSVRWPFLVLVGMTAAVFFATQRVAFQQTIGIITGVATFLPALVKAVSLLAGKGGTPNGT